MRVVRNSGGLAVSVALLACFVGGLGARAAAANLPVSSRWKAGTNYKVLDPAQPTNAPPGKVQVMEFFYLACPFCHALEPHIVAWRKTKPAYVHFVQVPVMWAPLQVSDARLFYTLLALRRDDLIPAAFHTIHRLELAAGGDENVMIGDTKAQTIALQEAFAERHGISGSAFVNAYNSFDVHVELERARQLGTVFQITATPTIIVDGRFKTGPSFFAYHGNESRLASGDRRTIQLINFLAQWVHDHPHA